MKFLFRTDCRVCAIARIHIALVFGILAAWRLRPEWFEFAKDAAVQHLAAIAVVLVFFGILSVKVFEHYRRSKPKDSNRDRLM
jgi:Na+/serine symporter